MSRDDGGRNESADTIEYELPWPEGLIQTELRDREEEAWMTGAVAIPELQSAVVKFELVDGPPID